MQTWFECKVKYLNVDENGCERKVTDTYLLDAVSFTDAETRISEQMAQLTNGEFQVMDVKMSSISEVIITNDGEWWYKAKICLVSIDEKGGREKKISNYILVLADDLKQALRALEKV